MSAEDTKEALDSLVANLKDSMLRKDLHWFTQTPLVFCLVLHDVGQHAGLKFVRGWVGSRLSWWGLKYLRIII